jgi:hypothetical protein
MRLKHPQIVTIYSILTHKHMTKIKSQIVMASIFTLCTNFIITMNNFNRRSISALFKIVD